MLTRYCKFLWYISIVYIFVSEHLPTSVNNFWTQNMTKVSFYILRSLAFCYPLASSHLWFPKGAIFSILTSEVKRCQVEYKELILLSCQLLFHCLLVSWLLLIILQYFVCCFNLLLLLWFGMILWLFFFNNILACAFTMKK